MSDGYIEISAILPESPIARAIQQLVEKIQADEVGGFVLITVSTKEKDIAFCSIDIPTEQPSRKHLAKLIKELSDEWYDHLNKEENNHG